MAEKNALSVMTQSLEQDDWQMVYDVDHKRLTVQGGRSAGKEFSINDFLAAKGDTRAGAVLEGLIIDMFPPEADNGA